MLKPNVNQQAEQAAKTFNLYSAADDSGNGKYFIRKNTGRNGGTFGLSALAC